MNIYVANFGTELNDHELKTLFTAHGEVAAAEVMIDLFTEKSRGFGYVEMPNEEEARAAITALNKTEIDGRMLEVEEAQPRDVRKGSYKVGNGGVNPYRFRKN